METQVKNSLTVDVSNSGFIDEGEGLVTFPNGLTITDDSQQRNGTRYDITSLDTSKYGGQITGDHRDELGHIIGEAIGTVKTNGRVVVNKIRYAINENPYARLAYNLLVGGFSKNFSTETIGPPPDENGIYWNAELVGLSQVVTQNNYNARVNQLIHNSLEQSKKDGFNVDGIEEKVIAKNSNDNSDSGEQTNMDEQKETKETETKVTETETKVVPETPVVQPVTPEQSTRVEAPPVVEAPKVEETKVTETKVEETKNENDETQKAPVVEDAQEDPKKIVETPHDPNAPVGQVQQDEKQQEQKESTPTVEEQKETNNKESKMDENDKKSETPNVESNALTLEAVANLLKPITDKVSALETAQKNAFDQSAKEPEFKKGENSADEKATNDYAKMDWQDRYNKQVEAAWNAVKLNSVTAWETLREINSVNLNALKKEGIAKNAMTLDDLGNFVIAPEMYNEIAGVRTDYADILNATEWRETLSLEFAWLQRTGDIDMRSVALHATDADPDANLKPISEYSATPKRSELEELAAVTVVATSATRFAAVDLLADAAAGYRNDYDRKRAQLVIARLEQAIDENGFTAGYTGNTAGEDMDSLVGILDTITAISDTTLNGTLVFNARTFARIKSHALRAGANGPLAEVLTTGNLPTLFGYRFLVVPNDLMPSLGGSETIAHEVDGVSVPINHAVYFADLSVFTGRTSGGLQYDVSNSAPYEVGGVTRSAYQRNELVLRGSFFRGGAVRDVNVVSGIRQGTGANVS